MPPESRYTFTDYSPDWPSAFERESARLRSLLADELVEIHHFGSTSVPGLAAKPIIDILPLVRRLAAVDELTPKLQATGYRAWGEYGLPGRRFFTRDHEGFRSHNIHIYETGSPGVERHLAFSAYLRHHEAARQEYEALKREVYARHPADIVAYNDGKDALIKRLEVVAVEWWRRRSR
ncbi:GrpB family protein [Planctomyces sp. SH-PL14]|uniref:GrpB family protein n=1 Tax=Planctomyces sp. SH-PL14 TaxID=1632864 RepID=UPI00078C7EA8|nr:GrpB family protein [Planctomyces sp. SH-PL14]AMV19046.1 dephospho-CoA kinase/protein folding accessory domain-containing protein [Planctomyces sp. SH-PL14]